MKPFKAVPVLKERIWGGQKLKGYHKVFDADIIGESWETDKDSMPVLIKLIDADALLSVQVHPNDALAWELEQQKNGKTEAWIVLDCNDGAELVAGIKSGVDREQLKQALQHGNIQDYLRTIKVKRGDCIYIPAGTVHSLGKGIVVYEVQQPSDLTYRLYDWDRIDDQGKPRELHVEKALQCIDYNSHEIKATNLYEQKLQSMQLHSLFQCDYFSTSYTYLEPEHCISYTPEGYTALTLISGSVDMSYDDCTEMICKGDTWILPAGNKTEIFLKARESAEIIFTTL